MQVARTFPRQATLRKLSSPYLPSHRRRMASSMYGPSSSIEEFSKVLKSSKRVIALCGAGLSAASGLDTFRGAGGMWRNHQATTLATPNAFRADPGLVWLFYSYRRHRALQAKPNAGHVALAKLAEKMPDFITLSQNVDGELKWRRCGFSYCTS
jgi:NAD-dependent deacetylase sirtuin 5